MDIKYLSACSGVEAASLAWRGLGWRAMAFAEVEPYRAVDLFAFSPFAADGADTDLRDGNHAREVIRRICGQGITDARPPRNAEELWRVVLRITHTRRGLASYAVDYRRRPGCPLECVGEMMGIYHEIKRVLRSARKERDARQKAT